MEQSAGLKPFVSIVHAYGAIVVQMLVTFISSILTLVSPHVLTEPQLYLSFSMCHDTRVLSPYSLILAMAIRLISVIPLL